MNGPTATPGGKAILVVDDDPVILKTLSTLLGSNGYRVLTAIDGPGAACAVAREKPDLILLDLLFPPDAMNVGGALQDGFLIMEWLRRMGEAQEVPIIVITADNSKKDREQALKAGAVALFSKPIDRFALLATIRTVLGEEVADALPCAA